MSTTRTKALKGCAILLGVVILLGLILLASMTWSVFRGYDEAVRTRVSLEGAFATQSNFTPARDGTISADRMRRFLAVRRALQPLCNRVSAHQELFQRMSEYGKMDRPPFKEIILDGVRVSRSMFALGHDFGEYIATRNQALLEHEMGLGEYTWIYVISYFSWLGRRPVRIIEGDNRPRVFQDRVFAQVRSMIERHVVELQALEENDPRAFATLQESLGQWRAEFEALSSNPERIPFEDGLPRELETSLNPFRRQFEELACPPACELEVVRTEKTGIRYDHR